MLYGVSLLTVVTSADGHIPLNMWSPVGYGSWEQRLDMNGMQLKHALSHFILDTRLGIVENKVVCVVTQSHFSVRVTYIA